MKYFSVFSGVGGFENGIGDNGNCVGFSEIDKHASAVLRYRFPHVKNYGSITDIDWSTVPDFDLLVGGSPCQDFSIAGKRAGLIGARSGLAYEYIRALEEKRPAHFIWENVKGVLSSNRGWDFAAILNQMAEAGYSLWWQVLNAKDFGVPQNRERVFVVGTRNGSPREVFFEQGNAGKNHGKGTRYSTEASRPEIGQAIRPYNADGIVPPLNNWSPCLAGSRLRRLTPVECERLMSWPDDWTKFGDYGNGPKEISDSQRYKMCGNGVVSEVVAKLVEETIK